MSRTTRAAAVSAVADVVAPVAAVVIAVVLLASACGGDEGSGRLIDEAERLVVVEPPVGWTAYVPPELGGNQLVREVDGVPVLYAGAPRDGELELFGVGVAWRSPVSAEADEAFAAACRATVDYAVRAGFAGAVEAEQLARCAELPSDPELRADFVASFADGFVDADGGNRTFGAGVLLDEAGTVSVVVSYAFGLDP